MYWCWVTAHLYIYTLHGDQLQVVSHFKYLGSIFTSDCTLDAGISYRVAAANSAFQQLRQANIWSSRALTLSAQCSVDISSAQNRIQYGREKVVATQASKRSFMEQPRITERQQVSMLLLMPLQHKLCMRRQSGHGCEHLLSRLQTTCFGVLGIAEQ